MTEDDQRLKLACPHILSGHKPLRPDAWLRQLAERPEAERPADFYGEGGAVSELETRTAALLGKEKGLFVLKGMTAQLAALKSYADRAGTSNVGIHPLGHMDMDEGNALEKVGGLTPVRIGRFAPFGPRELAAVTEPLAAVVVELPLRRAGYALPPLAELREISDQCRTRGIPLHFDGARIWETAAGYGIALAELAALADSLYVSFYKGLGAPGGAMVCGSDSFVRSLGVWKGRLGGNLFTAFPYALGGLAGLDAHLPRMPDYVERARALAARLDGTILLNPREPLVNAFQLLIPGAPAELTARNRRFAEAEGVWLFNHFGDSPIAGHATADIVIGDAADGWSIDEAAGWVESYCAMAI
ncbi:MAG: L-threonine aldolase [Alphaproteobacteria bacterium]|nr:L-threonine aldolase [Alphaproteobacteria bacterium]